MIWRACFLALVVCLVAGCGSGGGSGSGSTSGDGSGPTISSPSIDSPTLPSTGGQVTLRVTVQDPSGVQWVRATLTPYGGAADVRDLTLQPGGYYELVYTVPANLGTNDVLYSVTINAADPTGNLAAPLSVGSIRVLGDVSPPPPPNI